MPDPSNFDEKIFEEELLAAEQSVQAAEGQDIVLVVGVSGAGKSTLINYLQGRPLTLASRYSGVGQPQQANRSPTEADSDDSDSEGEARSPLDDDYVLRLETPDEAAPTMGATATSVTSYPGIYPVEIPGAEGLQLCDTAGFNDNQGGEERDLSVYLALQLVIKACRRVKAVVVVLREDHLCSDAMRTDPSLRQTLAVIDRLLATPDFYETSVFFLVNATKRTKKEIMQIIKQQKRDLDAKAAGGFFQRGSISPELEQIRSMLSLMRRHRENVILFDPRAAAVNRESVLAFPERAFRDGVLSREEVLARLMASQPMPAEAFQLAASTSGEQRLSAVISDIARLYLNTRGDISASEDRVQALQANIAEAEGQINELAQENQGYDAADGVFAPAPRNRAELGQQLAVLTLELTHIEEQRAEQVARQTILRESIAALASDRTEVKIHEKLWDEHVAYGAVKKGVIHDNAFDYNSGDVPIARVEYHGTQSPSVEGTPEKFEKQKTTQDAYHIHYYTPSHEYGRATIRIFAERRHIPDTKAKIAIWRGEVEQVTGRIRTIEDDIKRKRSRVDTIRGQLNQLIAEERQVVQEIIKKNEVTIKALCAEVDKHRQALDSEKVNLSQRQDTLAQGHPRFAFLLRLDRIFHFKNSLVKLFEEVSRDSSYDVFSMAVVPAPVAGHNSASAFFAAPEGPSSAECRDEGSATLSLSQLPTDLNLHQVAADGDCLYHAIGLQTGHDARSLRGIVADYLRTNPPEIMPFIDGPLDRYIEGVLQGAWGGHVEIKVLQATFNRPVVIFRRGNSPVIPAGFDEHPGEPIVIYYNDVDHYDGVARAPGLDVRVLITTLQQAAQQDQAGSSGERSSPRPAP